MEKKISDLEAKVKELQEKVDRWKKWGEEFKEILTEEYYLVEDLKLQKKEVMSLANIFDLVYTMLVNNNNLELFSLRYKVKKLDKEKAEILYGTKKKES